MLIDITDELSFVGKGGIPPCSLIRVYLIGWIDRLQTQTPLGASLAWVTATEHWQATNLDGFPIACRPGCNSDVL
ncbi:hypothetical protein CU100_09195 [Phyllobacterium endophyticum]|uniref:Uncharacterized protein n=1 Tax=Phyllobacterium endophyticum TaxID=1149773 RepID=A0A2P7AUH0_9HYPH|nr:hypothetical protein CU100_09195 [Phyllobacterium endophyticum]